MWRALLAALLFMAVAHAQSRVEGRIRNVSGEPLQGDVTIVEGNRDVRIRTVHTDSQGRFAFDAAPGRKLLVAKADGYVSEEREWTSDHGLANFALSPAVSISGRVVDETSSPVPGAKLSIRYTGSDRRFRYSQEEGEITADEFGYFELPFVARGATLIVEAETEERPRAGTSPLKVQGERLEGILVRLPRRGQTVRGIVVDAVSRPVAGASVRLHQPQAGVKLAETDTNGVFRFSGVDEGAAVIVARRPGARPAKTEITVGQTANLVIALP
jgi:hypothetical protein